MRSPGAAKDPHGDWRERARCVIIFSHMCSAWALAEWKGCMYLTRTVIVGGGPAGMSAAIAAARRGESVLLLERLDRVGKKLLATGNGRCNLMNRSAPAYPGGTAFARQVLASCGIQELEAFFHTLGLRLRTEDMGRVYPASGQAAPVLDALRLGLSRSGVELCPASPVSAITPSGRGFSLAVRRSVFNI